MRRHLFDMGLSVLFLIDCVEPACIVCTCNVREPPRFRSGMTIMKSNLGLIKECDKYAMAHRLYPMRISDLNLLQLSLLSR